MRAYDVQNGTLSGELCTFLDSTVIANSHSDANFLYIIEGLLSRTRVWRVPSNGSGACTLLADSATSSLVQFGEVGTGMTDTRIIVSGIASGGRYIQSLQKTGGTATNLVTLGGLNAMAIHGSYVFYGITRIGIAGTKSYLVGTVRDDGTDRNELPNMELPISAVPVGPLSTTSVEGRPQDLVRKFLLIDRTTPTTPTLTAIDGATRTTIPLGQLPDGLTGFLVFGLEDTVLGSFGRAAAPNEPDVYLMNTAVPNSLVRVTNTVGRAENVVPFYGF